MIIFIDLLSEKYSFGILSQSKNSLTVNINSIKVDFIRHNYPLLKEVEEYEGIRIASVIDIAAMKLNSIMNRGSRKDFFDIHELLSHFTLTEIITFHALKYNYSTQLILLKDLVYFDDAEKEPDPIILNSANWKFVKQRVVDVVNEIANNEYLSVF